VPWAHGALNVPRIAPPPQHLLVIDAQKIIAVPELVRRAVCFDARGSGHISFAPAAPQVGETTISTLTLPASALNAGLTAAAESPTTVCDIIFQ
jgi:hypothetical protein